MEGGVIRLARDALATADLRRLQIAWASAAVGGWTFMVALAVHAYSVGGATAVGLAALVRMVPAGLSAPLMGLAADRFPRRDVLLAASLVRAVLLAASLVRAVLLAVAAAAVAAGAPFALLLVLAAVFTVVAAAHKPAQAALLPRLAPSRRRQAAANALWSGIDNAAFVVGAIAGGMLVASFGAAAAFAAGALAFAVAASLVAGIVRDPAPARAPAASAGAAAVLAADTLAGVRVVVRDRRLRLLVGVLSASTLVEGMVDVLIVVTALRLVDLGDAGVGWLNAAWGVGGLAGGAVALGLVARGQLKLALPGGGLLVGLPLLALAWLPLPAVALALLVVLGVGYSLVEVAGLTLLQRLAADGVRARAFAVVESSYWLTTGVGAMLAPAVVGLAGPRAALALVGAALPLIVLARWAALTRLAPPPPQAARIGAAREQRVLEPV